MTIDIDLRPLAEGTTLHLPGDAGYDAARVAWNLAVDQRPAAVALPRTAAEVAQVVRAASAAGLRVAPQSTGHNAGPLAAQGLDDVVLVRMSGMDLVVADPARGIVRAEGGALWEPAVVAAAAHSSAVLHGSSPDVGITGYSLGGGIGWFARKLGLATNSVTAVELVTADGSLVRADAANNAELFWALRGGGGSFGVVTAIEFRMYPIETAYAGFLLWDIEHAEKVLREWAAWAPSAPDEITTAFRVMRLPEMPDLPDFLRGREIAIIDGAVLGSDDRGRELLGDLRVLRPEIDTFDRVDAASLVRLHMDPEGGAPVVSDTAMLGEFPEAALDAFLAEVGPGAETPLLLAELRQAGGALARPAVGGGALTYLDADFVMFAAAMAMTPSRRGRVRRRQPALRRAGAVCQRPAVPQLRGAPGRRRVGVLRPGLAAARRDPHRRGPGRTVRREPPGAAPVRERTAHDLTAMVSIRPASSLVE